MQEVAQGHPGSEKSEPGTLNLGFLPASPIFFQSLPTSFSEVGVHCVMKCLSSIKAFCPTQSHLSLGKTSLVSQAEAVETRVRQQSKQQVWGSGDENREAGKKAEDTAAGGNTVILGEQRMVSLWAGESQDRQVI